MTRHMMSQRVFLGEIKLGLFLSSTDATTRLPETRQDIQQMTLVSLMTNSSDIARADSRYLMSFKLCHHPATPGHSRSFVRDASVQRRIIAKGWPGHFPHSILLPLQAGQHLFVLG